MVRVGEAEQEHVDTLVPTKQIGEPTREWLFGGNALVERRYALPEKHSTDDEAG